MWKLKREGIRLREMIAAWLGNLYEPALKRRHDRWRVVQPVPKDEGIALTPKVAIFLIYQPKGVARSILATLRWLVANGYAPFVIANTPLSDADSADLAALSWRIFERPNFGYDFGGYRDGVLLLREWGIEPERLLIINDSVWMPTRADSTLIARLEAVEADVVGGIIHRNLTRRNGGLRPPHIESYLYMLNTKTVVSACFKRFWHEYPVSSNKRNAVRNGERKLTPALARGGLTVAGIFSPNTFVSLMGSQDDQQLCKTLEYASLVDPTLIEENSRLLRLYLSELQWRDQAMDHIKRCVDRRRFNACFIYPSDHLFGMDFIKKSPGSTGDGSSCLHSRMRRQLLRAVASGDLPALHPDIESEIKELEALIG
ncbi:rhamnan synthesis F family protein [Tabrizicola sp.]|uniref:rhamnan synthesis F family protein n=1 Tax=Tabrizicola sp. TaxID=2005166 RepID=UPI00286AC773|nr:rhamnan synthesis F family protein [Tabrizicola sp.]